MENNIRIHKVHLDLAHAFVKHDPLISMSLPPWVDREWTWLIITSQQPTCCVAIWYRLSFLICSCWAHDAPVTTPTNITTQLSLTHSITHLIIISPQYTHSVAMISSRSFRICSCWSRFDMTSVALADDWRCNVWLLARLCCNSSIFLCLACVKWGWTYAWKKWNCQCFVCKRTWPWLNWNLKSLLPKQSIKLYLE